jgi:hypothetical protein
VGRSVRPVICLCAADPSRLSDRPGCGGGSEVDVRSSVECPISLRRGGSSVDGWCRARAGSSDRSASYVICGHANTFTVAMVAVVAGVEVVVVLVRVVVIVVEVAVVVVVGGR